MFCLQCGNKLPEDAIFCNRCGTNVRPSDSGLRGQSPPGRITRQFGDGTPSSGADWSQSQPTVQAFPPPQSSGANWLQSQTVLPGAQTWQPPVGNWSQSQPAGTAWSQPSPMMPAPASAQSLPASVMQRLLIHIFKPSLAGNALLGVLLGSILAIVLGVLISDLLLAVAHAITPQTVYLPFTGKNSEDSDRQSTGK